MNLKTDYTDDVFEGERKYRLSQNPDGSTNISDITTYTSEGDRFGANDINATNQKVNKLDTTRKLVLQASAWSSTAPFTQTISVSGVRDTDVPVGSILVSKGASKDMKKAAECVDGFETGNGSITFYCNKKKPTVVLVALIKGV